MNAAAVSSSPTPPVFTQTVTGPYSFFATTVGKKVIMAVTGAALFGFTIAHMSGNLLVFLGPQAMNEYGEWLRGLGHGAVLWAMRGALLLAVALHGWAAVSLSRESLAARPVGYRKHRFREASVSSRTMRWGGIALAFFIVYHLMHFTIGNANPHFRQGDPYHSLVTEFQSPVVALVYVAAMIALGLHLYHGAWSFTQTLGWAHPRFDRLRRVVTGAIAIAVVLGFVSIPLAVLFGVVR